MQSNEISLSQLDEHTEGQPECRPQQPLKNFERKKKNIYLRDVFNQILLRSSAWTWENTDKVPKVQPEALRDKRKKRHWRLITAVAASIKTPARGCSHYAKKKKKRQVNNQSMPY